MPYICLAQDLPDGTVQILDLKPNTSQRNLIYEPPGQTQYVNRVQTGTLTFSAVDITQSPAVNGLNAYLVDRVEPTDVAGWSAANQTTVAQALIARMDAGQTLTLAAVNAVIQATHVGSDLDGAGSNSTGTLAELLAVMAGREYTLGPGFAKLGVAVAWDATQAGSFTEAVVVNDPDLSPPVGGVTVQYERKPIVTTVHSSAFAISLAVGHLASLATGVTLFPDSVPSAFHPNQFSQPGPQVAQLTGARVVTVYDDDGTVLA